MVGCREKKSLCKLTRFSMSFLFNLKVENAGDSLFIRSHFSSTRSAIHLASLVESEYIENRSFVLILPHIWSSSHCFISQLLRSDLIVVFQSGGVNETGVYGNPRSVYTKCGQKKNSKSHDGEPTERELGVQSNPRSVYTKFQ